MARPPRDSDRGPRSGSLLRSSPMARRSTVNRGDGGSTPPFAAKVTLRADPARAGLAARVVGATTPPWYGGETGATPVSGSRRERGPTERHGPSKPWDAGSTPAARTAPLGARHEHAAVVQGKDVGVPIRRRGFDSRRLHRAPCAPISPHRRPGARASSADCNPASLGCDSPPGLPGVLRRSLAAVAQWLGTWLSPRPVRVRFPSVAPRRTRRACGHRLAVRTAVSRTANEGSIPSDHAAAPDARRGRPHSPGGGADGETTNLARRRSIRLGGATQPALARRRAPAAWSRRWPPKPAEGVRFPRGRLDLR